MRRRRLIGVYRGLLMSILDAVAPVSAVMSAAAGAARLTTREHATRPSPQASRSGSAAQSRPRALFARTPNVRITSFSVALTIAPRYARPHPFRRWTIVHDVATTDLMRDAFRS